MNWCQNHAPVGQCSILVGDGLLTAMVDYPADQHDVDEYVQIVRGAKTTGCLSGKSDETCYMELDKQDMCLFLLSLVSSMGI